MVAKKTNVELLLFQQIEEVLDKENIPHTNLNLNVHPKKLYDLNNKEWNYLKHRESTKMIAPSVRYAFPESLTVIISNHALERWNERIGPMIEHKTLYYYFLQLHKQRRIQYYKGRTLLGVIDNEIVFVYEKKSWDKIVILTFAGRVSVKTKLRNLSNYNNFSKRKDTLDLSLVVDSQIFLEQTMPVLPFAYSSETDGGSNLYIECYGKEKPFIFLRSKSTYRLIDVTQYLWDCKKKIIMKNREKNRIKRHLQQEKNKYEQWIYQHYILKEFDLSENINSFEEKWTAYQDEYELSPINKIKKKCIQKEIQKINNAFKKSINYLENCPFKYIFQAKEKAEKVFNRYSDFIEGYTLENINQIYEKRMEKKTNIRFNQLTEHLMYCSFRSIHQVKEEIERYFKKYPNLIDTTYTLEDIELIYKTRLEHQDKFPALSEVERTLLQEYRTINDFKNATEVLEKEQEEHQEQRNQIVIDDELPFIESPVEEEYSQKDEEVTDWLLDIF